MAHTVKNLSAMQETWVQSLGWEDPLKKEMAAHSRFLPGEAHGLRSLVGYSLWGRKELDMTEHVHIQVMPYNICLRGDFKGFPHSSDGKESVCNARDLGSIPRLGRSPGEGNGNPLQYFCLENSMDRGAWRATVHGVAKSWTQLSD